jgi:hypothetical protein
MIGGQNDMATNVKQKPKAANAALRAAAVKQ